MKNEFYDGGEMDAARSETWRKEGVSSSAEQEEAEEGSSSSTTSSSSSSSSDVEEVLPDPASPDAKPTLHLIGLFFTVTSMRWSHCAFTMKVFRFPKMMRMQGYRVIEYSNGESESEADEKVPMLPEPVLKSLISRKDTDTRMGYAGDAIIGSRHWHLFDQALRAAMRQRVRRGDIVCHAFGPCHKGVVAEFSQAVHVESGIGYPNPFLAFRIYESYAYMHWHFGRVHSEVGANYHFVVPNYYDLDDWDVCVDPPAPPEGQYVLFFGRIYSQKGLDTVVEIARRLEGKRRVVICGHGEPEQYLRQVPSGNLEYREPITGRARSELLGKAYCVLMPTVFIEPFGGSGVEAMLCGTPLVAVACGAFTETVVPGVTGFLCNTLGDWMDAIEACQYLDRRNVAAVARQRYSLQTCGKQYDTVFRRLHDVGTKKGWYETRSHGLQRAVLDEHQPDAPSETFAAGAPEKAKPALACASIAELHCGC